ncbi:MAG: hypothetical protein RMM17_09415 [Acidobacteriota bacterium]|nr:hypothetical protein [Blastocatellia bacterium]MDW8412887.1 hypothetical protein [Acidobacteriota bacterium]
MKLLVLVLALALPISLKADTIYLKDGRKIKCDAARQEGKLLRYWIGDVALSVPIERVEKIARDDDRGEELKSTRDVTQLPSVISGLSVVSISVDDAELRRLEEGVRAAPGNVELRRRLVRALVDTGYLRHQSGEFVKAKDLLLQALAWDNRDVAALVLLADICLRDGRYSESLEYATRATTIDPQNQIALYQKGAANYALDKLEAALTAWRSALKLAPNPAIAALISKVEKELSLNKEFTSRHNRFFVVSFEGNVEPWMQSELLSKLDDSYVLLSRRFGYVPSEKISVIFYTRQAFFDITRAPSWAGALNDGKIRVPVGGLIGVSDELSRTLIHELVHSFVHFKSKGRCPTWLNEGLAQLLEGRSPDIVWLASLQSLPKLSTLSTAFTGLSSVEARIAYAYSLAAVEVLAEKGLAVVVAILEDLARNYDVETALSRNTKFDSLQALEREVASRLGK